MSFLVSAVSNMLGGLLEGGSNSASSLPLSTTASSAAAPFASLLPQAQADNYLSSLSLGALQSFAGGSSSSTTSGSTDDDAASSLISQSSNGSSGTSSLFGAQNNMFAPSQVDGAEGGGDDE